MNKSDTGFAFNSPQDVQALTYLQGLAKKGYLKFTPGDGVDAGLGRRSLRHRPGGHDR